MKLPTQYKLGTVEEAVSRARYQMLLLGLVVCACLELCRLPMFLCQLRIGYRPKVILSASGGLRGSKVIELKQIVDDACALTKGKFDVRTACGPSILQTAVIPDSVQN